MKRFILCAGCSRHVHAGETGCPFCGAAVAAESAGVRQGASAPLPRRAGRGAWWIVGAAATAATVACGGTTDDSADTQDPSTIGDGSGDGGGEPGSGGQPGDGNGQIDPDPGDYPPAQPVYGAPFDPGDEPPMAQPEYGAPFIPDDGGIAVDAGAGGDHADAGAELADAEVQTDEAGPGGGMAAPLYGAPFVPEQ